jgi:mannose-6-phosphate isomerase-like protein (cupin superfamily)
MNHTAGVAQSRKFRAVREETIEKRVAHIPPGAGTTSLWVMGVLATYKVPSQWTGGAYALFEVATQPGSGPPPHIHHREDESFYVLEGEYEFLVDKRTVMAQAGSLIYVPKGCLHAHNGVGKGVGRMLVTQTPGGLYERFFEEVGRPVEGEAGPGFFEERPDAQSIAATAAKYGIEIRSPIGGESEPDDSFTAAAP